MGYIISVLLSFDGLVLDNQPVWLEAFLILFKICIGHLMLAFGHGFLILSSKNRQFCRWLVPLAFAHGFVVLLSKN